MKNPFDKMMEIIAFLEENHVYYRISKVSDANNSIMIDLAIPGERWEIDIQDNGQVSIDKFIYDMNYYDETALEELVEKNENRTGQNVEESSL